MLFILIALVAVGREVLATSPIKLPPKCPLPTVPYVKPKCGPNAYFEICSKPCPPQNCSSLWSKYACLETCCKPECRCKDGFLRDDKSGICISVDECLFPCGPLEHFVRDSTECQRTCANYKVTGPRSLCKPFTGCVCDKGRVRLNDDGTGVCILPKQCPARKCPIFEHWDDCPSVCLKESCISKSPDYKCLLPAIPLPCKPRCVCDKGHLRDSFGNCIPEKRCPIKKCPVNEVWRCTGMCTRDSCARNDPNFKCPIGKLSVCIPACACKDGFRRNDRGICIPQKSCPKTNRCGINEVAVKCATVSPLQTCESVYTQYRPVGIVPCNPGCDCRPGYLRNKFNICIPSECCPTVPQNQCGPFQEYKTCGTACEPSCADLDNPYQICTDQCVKGCFCKDGYVKDEQGNCVTRDQCPLPVCNKPNEVAKECGSGCEVKTCDDYKRTDIVCPAVCIRGCFCRDGYVRNPYGICVLPKECPSHPVCLLENEEFQPCGSSCPDNCDNYKDAGRVCTKNCVPACNCKAGFVRNLVDKTCVKPEQCPTKECTGLNESLNLCASYCPVTCANRLNNGDWACATVCRVACDCIPGTLRNDSGVCVPVAECTPPVCRQNEMYQQCGTACPLTCDNYKKPPQFCTLQCVSDCFCSKGYVRDRKMRCVKPEECETICPAGEKFNQCSAHCQETCENRDQPNRICTLQCQSGCVCEEGTVRRKDGKCVPPLECTAPPTCSNGTEIYSPCSAHCEPTCENSSPNQPCTRICKPGCKCIDGLVRRKDGQCVKVEECSQPTCSGDEVYDPCSAHCEDTCESNGPGRPCTAICKPGCRCGKGLVRRKDGQCVKLKDCSNSTSCADPNAVTRECAVAESCRPTCAQPNPQVCPKICIVNGCECQPGYVLSEKGGKCVKIEECPLQNATCNGDPNAIIKANPQACPSTCDVPNGSPACKKLGPAVGCECKPGYLRSEDGGKCIPPDQCPGGNPCGKNATFVWCRVNCPTNDCPVDDSRAIFACDPTYPCPSGCSCRLNYRRRSFSDDTCTLASECPPVKCTRPNEIWSPCPSACLRENCADVNDQPTTCNPLVLNCQPQCICKKGHFRNEKDICVPANQCPINQPCSDPNAERIVCAPVCRSTCAKPDPGPCILSCKLNDCVCKKGFILSGPRGICIPVDQCPKDAPCNGDSNAVIKANPIPCPSTCNAPNASPHCKKYAPEVGCECKPGFLKSTDDIDGKCIQPDTCPGGNPCGANGTFVWCNVNCPTNNCPVNDNRGIIACSPPFPCPSGCACKLNHRKNSYDDNQCILASDCPPVKCTRPNEIWSPCPSACLREKCADVNDQPTTCNPLVLNCQPQCICKKGYFRNEEDICVPAKQCPINQPCSDPNAERIECAPVCRSTCAKPDPGPCILSCKLNDCVCKKGFILSGPRGICIPVDQCPKDAPCNGDSNAVIKANPIPCPSTCNAPNASPHCKKYAPKVGCVCKPGFLKSTDDIDGKCIQPDTCPGGNPCGANGTFVSCNVNCPTNNCPVNDNRGIIACKPAVPCPSGCACKLNYKKNSSGGNQCILASDCPPVKCTRPNEEWSPCPSACLAENCDDINNQPTTCNTLVLNCQPRCICKKGHFRNKKGICVPANQCPNQSCSDPNAERVECAPDASCRSTCAVPNPGPCIEICAINECVCKQGFVLSKEGKCVTVEQCPVQNSCNGDPNAVIKTCPLPCPATCNSPNAIPCRKACLPVGCECKDGYIFSENGGQCIRPEKCKGGNPCGRNETYVSCNVNCPSNNCPVNNSPNTVVCETPNPCYPGCVCKINYRRRSVQDPTCILASECPPVKCYKNEVWSGCPSACLAEDCSNVNDKPVTCNTLLLNCQPKCICKKGYFRDSNRNCVPANQCPKPIKCKVNEVYSPCSFKCPPQTCASIYSSYDCSNATKCEPGCNCISEYLRNGTETDLCIPSSQCPEPTPVCGLNEHYEINRIKCDLSCNTKDQQALIGPCQETSGCFCDDGHARNDNGICVTLKQCPKKICPADEVLSECYNSCLTTCRTRIRGDGRQCHLACIDSGCVCKPDYLRHDNGTCVPISECSPPQCNENETYLKCGTACPPTCQNRGDNCTVCTKQCVEGCFCNKGLVRADDGSCIAPKKCPLRTCDDPKETFAECPPSCPGTDGCSLLWSKFNCTGAVRCCKPQCRCNPGLFRGPSGVCITAKQCTTPVCGLNEHYEENRLKCDLSCNTKDQQALIGPCQETSGCFCDDGHARNDNGICVTLEQCPPPQCNENETYLKCGTACPPTCQNRGNNCTVCTEQCVEGCFCNKGLVRADDGSCIAPKKCPLRTCDNPNETFDECPPSCPGTDGCSLLWSKFNCTGAVQCCKPQCRCNPGLYRGPSGVCITAKQCTNPIKCKENEVYNPCSIKCPPQTCASIYTDYYCNQATECQPGCDCIAEYLRNGTDTDLCIPSSQCPGPTPVCGLNEHYEINRIKCDLSCNTKDQQALIGPCQETSGCFCDDGHARNDNGICVTLEQCPPPQCNENETYLKCGTACPPTCQNRGDNCTVCTEQCVEGCFCNKGLVRADDGCCIAPKNCPLRTCDNPNETFNECPPSCPGTDGCSLLWSKFNCTGAVRCCKPQCRCNPGLFRGPSGVCITAKQCTSRTSTLPVEPPPQE